MVRRLGPTCMRFEVWDKAEGGGAGCPGQPRTRHRGATRPVLPGTRSTPLSRMREASPQPGTLSGCNSPDADGQTCWYWGLAATYQTLVNGYTGASSPCCRTLPPPITASVWPWRRRLGTARGEPETSRAIATIRCRRHELVPTAPSQCTGREASAPLLATALVGVMGLGSALAANAASEPPATVTAAPVAGTATTGSSAPSASTTTTAATDRLRRARPRSPSDHHGAVVRDGTSQKQPPWGGYRVNVPPVWRYIDQTIPSDHVTNLWTDPRDPGQRLTVVASGCIGFVMHSLTDRSLIPSR